MSFFARSGLGAKLKRAAAASQRRNMSGHGSPEEIFQSKEMWFKTSVIAAGAVIAPFSAFILYKEMTHEHHHAEKVYSHMHIRRKGFPWKENDCGLFDMHCKHEWRAAHGGH